MDILGDQTFNIVNFSQSKLSKTRKIFDRNDNIFKVNFQLEYTTTITFKKMFINFKLLIDVYIFENLTFLTLDKIF